MPGVAEQRSFCRICQALCGIVVTTRGDEVLRVRGDPDHPLSRGYTCPKGRALPAFHHDPDRLDQPLVRGPAGLAAASWDDCLDDLAARVGAVVSTSGPAAVGAYLATAAAFDANGWRTAERLMRAIGSPSRYSTATVDTACKPYVSELLSGFPGLVPKIDRAGCRLTLLVGTNPVVSHGHWDAMPDPVTEIRDLVDRGAVWVVDPRTTETARLATRHLRVRPGTSWALLAHVVREVLDDGADRAYLTAHAAGTEALAAAVAPFDRTTTAARTGLPPGELDGLVAAVRAAGRLAVCTGTGSTMGASANVAEWLAWSLVVITGSFDRPGGMWCNPGYLACHDRRDWAPSDGIPGPGPASRPDLPGRWGEYPSAALVDEIEAGNLRALLVVGGNPVTAFPETGRLRRALARLDVLAVVDVVATATTELATHVLPAAGQLERADLPVFPERFQGAVASQYTPAMVPLGADRRPAWWILGSLARRLGHDVLPDAPDGCTDDGLLRPIADRGRSSFDELVAAGTGVVAERSTFGWVTERVLPEGRWRVDAPPIARQLAELAAAPPTAGLVLVPRRQPRHMNSQLADRASTGTHPDRPEVVVHPDDAEGLVDGGLVDVVAGPGTLRLTLHLDADVARGTASVPHGFTDVNVGLLTSATDGVDPLTGMVRQAGVPVELRAVP